jgi:hypothetical protein
MEVPLLIGFVPAPPKVVKLTSAVGTDSPEISISPLKVAVYVVPGRRGT